MNKKLKLSVYPLIIFTAAVFAAGYIRSLSDYDRLSRTTSAGMIQYDSLYTSQSYDFDASDNINIVFNGESVSILENYRYTEPAFILTVNGTDRYLTDTQYYSKDGNDINIDYSRSYGILEIILPKDYRYSTINIDAPQANISITNLDTEKIYASTTSGSISCDGVYAECMDLSSIRGNIYIYDTDSQLIELESGSGNITSFASCAECYIKTGSGNIDFDPDELYIRADLSSEEGDVRFTADPVSDTSVNIYKCGKTVDASPDYTTDGYGRYTLGDACINVNIYAPNGSVILEIK